MNICYPIISQNKYELKCPQLVTPRVLPVSDSQRIVDDVSFKSNSHMVYSYGITGLSNNENISKNPHDYYDLNKWKFLSEVYTSHKKEVEPLKLESEEDYMTLIDDLDKNKIEVYDYNDFRQKKYYPNLPDKYLGLLPYCGIDDYSLDINKYMSGREIKIMSKYQPRALNKLCSILDYSLNELDKEYGKYEGIVYRFGFFDADVPQYFSTSIDPKEKCYADLLKVKQEIDEKNDNPNNPDFQLNIIRAKNGHKIYDFQKNYLCLNGDDNKIDKAKSYLDEQEILLPKSSIFNEVYDDEELNELKTNLAKSLLPYCVENNIKGLNSVEEITKHIKIWEEVDTKQEF